MSRVRCMITVFNETVPLVFIDKKYADNENELVLDDTNPNLMQKIEEISKILKRADYHRIVLVKGEILDANIILTIARLFQEEDIEVIGVYNNNLALDVYKRLNAAFKYGVIDMMMLLEQAEERKKYKKIL